MFSQAVCSLSRLGSWKTMPKRWRASFCFTVGSRPSSSMRPLVGRNSVVSILMVVVFPAPFGPRKANISPCATSKLMSLTAVKSPNFLTRWLTEIIPGDTSFCRQLSLYITILNGLVIHVKSRPFRGSSMLLKVWKNVHAMVDRPYSENPDYRETIRRAAFGDRKYIRYFAGRGHFAHLRLQLIPCPGELCRVTTSDGLEIPELCCAAAQASILKKFEAGPLGSYPMLGLEARIIGGTFLPKYSHAEAFARAASMAFDE